MSAGFSQINGMPAVREAQARQRAAL